MMSFMTSYGTCSGSIKGPGAVPRGDSLVQPPSGKEVRMHTQINALVRLHCQSLLPSNITGLLELVYVHLHQPTHQYTSRAAWERRVLL